MSISEHKHMSEREPTRRIEVFTGAGRRRIWSVDQKAAIVAESCVSGASVCEVARRHGLTPQQLFSWRRQAHETSRILEEAVEPPLFVPALVAAPPEKLPRRTARLEKELAPTIELEVEGVTVRVGPGAQAKTIAAVNRTICPGVNAMLLDPIRLIRAQGRSRRRDHARGLGAARGIRPILASVLVSSRRSNRLWLAQVPSRPRQPAA